MTVLSSPLLRCGALAVCLLGFASCQSSTNVSLDYQPGLTQIIPGPSVVAAGRFADIRNEDAYVLGAVRTPLGTPVEYVSTNVPVDQVVRNAFAYGLRARHMMAPENRAQYLLTGQIIDFGVRQMVHPSADIRIRINLIDRQTSRVVYARDFRADRQSGMVLPGMGSPVPAMRDLASRVLQELVDRALDDVVFRSKLHSAPPPMGGGPPPAQ
jgi:hypothetical protein